MPDYPLVNSHRMSFASIELTLNGRSFLGFRAINYTETCEPGLVRGAHAQILGRTIGDYVVEASAEVYDQEFHEFIGEIGDGFLEEAFDVTVVYAEEGQNTIKDELRGCRIQAIERSHSQGTDPLALTLTLHPIVLIRNGQNPLRRMLQGNSITDSAWSW